MKKRDYDAVILGNGIAGLSTAIHLAKKRKRVLVMGYRGAEGAASTAATGILDPVNELKPGSDLFKLASASFKKYPSFIKDLERNTGGNVDYRKTGLLLAPAVVRGLARWLPGRC